ncbi:hypothetical protein BGZ65_005098 [Modicella reniformis]|uniref:AAA+ ATPase domain-containing protein n=1 Tax=Modicella reniformis TaxID=1440133 RepID=A0A9P6IP00_9FUNG|nr:hypothetical protein BGZ65_005098 [Modicella reniformis]
MPARYNNIILSSPCEGSSQMLETMVMLTAGKLGADMITIDMQDLMELTSDIFNSKGAGNPWPVDQLSRGFNPFISAPVPGGLVDDDDDIDDDCDVDSEDDDDGHDEQQGTSIVVHSRIFGTKALSNRDVTASTEIAIKEKFTKLWTALLLAEPPTTPLHDPPGKILYLKDIADIIRTPLGSTILPSLTSAAINLRRAGHNVMVIAGHSPSLLSAKTQYDDEVADEIKCDPTYMDTGTTGSSPLAAILQKLRSSEASNHQSENLNGLASMTYDTFPGPTQCFHHISIPPYLPPAPTSTLPLNSLLEYSQLVEHALANKKRLKQDKADRIKEINSRNLLAVLSFRGGFLAESETSESAFHSLPGIDSEVWGFGKIYRIISNAIGARYQSEINQCGQVSKKVYLAHEQFQYGLTTTNENAKLRNSVFSQINSKRPTKPVFRIEECDRYERRLFGSIVDPDQIKTTFKNTIIPSETIQTLQTMITLPLVRPQLFSYGLLQDEFLSGLLLFGPPGTGKTLLAKAVAKESGARMLEIKASNIFDMYVGEGEKNVSAVFRLARKLSPCVIFLDEVDSIFCSRARGGSGGIGGGNSSQREILNQFMVEWDGLRSSGQNQGIVVMASTNRPFELDDAVLRRLPRRILVDLPSEEARHQILKVYLGKEQLEDDVEIKEIAKRTEFFSGSDLKNLCVSATLACVREDVENEIRGLQSTEKVSGAKDGSSDAVIDLSLLLDQYKKETMASEATSGDFLRASLTTAGGQMEATPARILRKSHFEKAFLQITPSCSENMESLTELRKWDGLYGDGGKARRKLIRGIGFDVGPTSSKGDKK